MQIYRDAQIDPAVLSEKTVAIIGYGNQGRPQALNARDSGLNVIVGLRAESPRRAHAKADDFTVLPLEDAARQADVLMLLIADEGMADAYRTLLPKLRPGHYLGFCHGMAIQAGLIAPEAGLNVFLLAPKAQGRGVRDRYRSGLGVPGLVAVHQDATGDTKAVALAYGRAIGCGMTGMIDTTFDEETISNQLSEQTVLCGGLTQLMKTSFEVQIEAGISPAVAYFGCLHEVKLLAELVFESGISGMRERISPTARYGDLTRGPRVIDGHVKATMAQLLAEIRSREFATEFLADVDAGAPRMRERFWQDAAHPLEETGRALRDAGLI